MPEYIPEERSIEELVAAAQEGDHTVQDYLLNSYKPLSQNLFQRYANGISIQCMMMNLVSV